MACCCSGYTESCSLGQQRYRGVPTADSTRPKELQDGVVCLLECCGSNSCSMLRWSGCFLEYMQRWLQRDSSMAYSNMPSPMRMAC